MSIRFDHSARSVRSFTCQFLVSLNRSPFHVIRFRSVPIIGACFRSLFNCCAASMRHKFFGDQICTKCRLFVHQWHGHDLHHDFCRLRLLLPPRRQRRRRRRCHCLPGMQLQRDSIWHCHRASILFAGLWHGRWLLRSNAIERHCVLRNGWLQHVYAVWHRVSGKQGEKNSRPIFTAHLHISSVKIAQTSTNSVSCLISVRHTHSRHLSKTLRTISTTATTPILPTSLISSTTKTTSTAATTQVQGKITFRLLQ